MRLIVVQLKDSIDISIATVEKGIAVLSKSDGSFVGIVGKEKGSDRFVILGINMVLSKFYDSLELLILERREFNFFQL